MVALLGVALLLGLTLSLVNPALLLWIALGLTLAFVPDVLRELGVPPNRVLRIGLALLALIGIVGLVPYASLNVEGPRSLRPDRFSILVTTEYAGHAKLTDNPDRLIVTDTVTIPSETIEVAARQAARSRDVLRPAPGSGGLSERGLLTDIENALTAQGWTTRPPNTAGRTFARTRTHDVDFPRVKAQRTLTLGLPHPRLETKPPSSYFIDLRRAAGSTLVVTGEKNALAEAFPEGRTQSHLRDDLEETTISDLQNRDEVELKVRRPLFREEPFVRVADFTLAKLGIAVVLFFFAAVGALAKDELKKLLKRLLDRVLGRKPEPETG